MNPYCVIFHTCWSESGWSCGYPHTNTFCSCVINTLVLLALLMTCFLKGQKIQVISITRILLHKLIPYSSVLRFNQPERKGGLSVPSHRPVQDTGETLALSMPPFFIFIFKFQLRQRLREKDVPNSTSKGFFFLTPYNFDLLKVFKIEKPHPEEEQRPKWAGGWEFTKSRPLWPHVKSSMLSA